MKKMIVEKIRDSDFVKLHLDFERYVLVHSDAFEAIFSEKMKDAQNPNELEGLVKIIHNGKTIYRKCIGGAVTKDHIQMGYRTKSELQASIGDAIDVKKACWFCYLWRNSDSYYKYPFRIAVVAFIFATFTFIYDIVQIVISLYS